MEEFIAHSSVTTPTDGVGEKPAFTEEQIEQHEITPEELEAAGQEPVEEQKLAGKFKSQEDLENAYLQLEKKFHSGNNEEPQGEQTEQAEQPQESKGSPEIQEAFNELMKEGKLTDEITQKFEAAGVPKEIVEQVDQLNQYKAEKELNDFYSTVGSEQEYKELVSWAGENLSQEEIDTFNNIVSKGSTEELKFAITNLNARRENKTSPRKSNLIKADATSAPTEKGYPTQAHMLADINNPLYHNDPSFRDKVLAKAKNSNF